jgi:hypothetical protein
MYANATGALSWTSMRPDLERALAELETIRQTELESANVVKGTRRMIVCVENALRIDTELTDGIGISSLVFQRINVEAAKAAENAALALSHIREAAAELSADSSPSYHKGA